MYYYPIYNLKLVDATAKNCPEKNITYKVYGKNKRLNMKKLKVLRVFKNYIKIALRNKFH